MNVFDPNFNYPVAPHWGQQFSWTRFLTFLAWADWIPDENQFIPGCSWVLIVGSLYSMHNMGVIWAWSCLPSARSCICSIPSHWGQRLEEVGPTTGTSGMKGMWECAAGSKLSQHQRHKHTMSSWIVGHKDCGRRDVVCWVIWKWVTRVIHKKICYDIPHEYVTFSTNQPWIQRT